jgi:hypothetical protein
MSCKHLRRFFLAARRRDSNAVGDQAFGCEYISDSKVVFRMMPASCAVRLMTISRLIVGCARLWRVSRIFPKT